jgi:hypothetical protein
MAMLMGENFGTIRPGLASYGSAAVESSLLASSTTFKKVNSELEFIKAGQASTEEKIH